MVKSSTCHIGTIYGVWQCSFSIHGVGNTDTAYVPASGSVLYLVRSHAFSLLDLGRSVYVKKQMAIGNESIIHPNFMW